MWMVSAKLFREEGAFLGLAMGTDWSAATVGSINPWGHATGGAMPSSQ